MQGQLVPYFMKKKLTGAQLFLENEETNANNSEIDVTGMAEIVAGYMDCIEEAVNYLKDVERYSDDHPAIVGLRKHLAYYQEKFMNVAVQINAEFISKLPSSQS